MTRTSCGLINYIHLNPVRAGLAPVARLVDFRWSSVRALVRGPRPNWLGAATLLGHLGLADTAAGWRRYLALLAEIALDRARLAADDEAFTRGWAIGSPDWKSKVLVVHPTLADDPGISSAARRAANEARWQEEFTAALTDAGKSALHIAGDPKGAGWKIAAAVRLRLRTRAPHRSIAQTLNMGCAASVRVYVSRQINL